jgi:hypothetical protein
MNEFQINVPQGKTMRLLTGGTYCPEDIFVTAEGGGAAAPALPKDVNFYDYDGTLLYAYTVAEAQALTELPPAPTPPKDFLQFEEWNWTLAQIKAYNDPVEVGAVYKPIDNKTRVVIQIDEDWQKNVVIRYCQWCANVTVDWGDGSAADTTAGGNGENFTATHTYASKGTYTIAIEAGTWNLGHNTNTAPFFGNMTTENGSTALREMYCGSSARFLLNGLYKTRKLKCLTIPKGQTQLWAYAVQYCSSLKALIFPSTLQTINQDCFILAKAMTVCSLPPSLTTINTRAFQGSGVLRFTIPHGAKTVSLSAYNVETVVLKDGVTTIGDQCFQDAEKLTEVTVPQTVTIIGSLCFSGCVSMLRLRFLPTNPPTVSNANAFNSIPTNCVVEVPAGSLAAYKAATNYASVAAQMVGV